MILWCLSLLMAHAAPGVTVGLQPAQSPQGFGVGVYLGEPVGLSASWRPDERFGLQGGVGWSTFQSMTQMHLDAVYSPVIFELAGRSTLQLPVYVGVGAQLELGDSNVRWRADPVGVSARFPVGVMLRDTELPFDVFAELVPVFVLYPVTDLDLDFGVGARLYF